MSNSLILRWKRNNLLRSVDAGKVDCPACQGLGDCNHCNDGLMPLDLALMRPELHKVTPADVQQFQGRGR
jgi:hypothetical protein